MFDLNEFMNAPCEDETFVVRRGVEEFRLRRMNGSERLQFNDLTTQHERTLFVLSHCLLNGPDSAPIGAANAERLLERAGGLAEALYADVYDATQATLEAEKELWRSVKKK